MRARRLPVLDEFVEGGESAVFVGGHVVTLSVLATTVLGALDEQWHDVGDVEPLLLETFGPPAEGSVGDALVEVLHALEQHHLVETDPEPAPTLPA